MENIYYNIDTALSHNCLFNFLLGARGIGKTYSAKRRVIKNYLRSGAQFVYLRRYDTELKKDKLSKFFNDIAIEFNEHELGVNNKEFTLDKEPIGYAMALTQAAQYKSTPFPDVSMIIFDEFIIDKSAIRYLPNEVESFLEMYSTIARDRDVTVVFLSNAITFTNPYFLYFDIEIQPGQQLLKKSMIPGERKDILVEIIKNDNYSAHMKNTRLGKIVANTAWGGYSIDNEFLRDDSTFIEPMQSACYCMFNVRTSNGTFGVYNDNINGLLYVSEQYDPSVKYTIAINTTSHNTGTVGLNGIGKGYINILKDNFMSGQVRFTSMKAKNITIEIMKYHV